MRLNNLDTIKKMICKIIDELLKENIELLKGQICQIIKKSLKGK